MLFFSLYLSQVFTHGECGEVDFSFSQLDFHDDYYNISNEEKYCSFTYSDSISLETTTPTINIYVETAAIPKEIDVHLKTSQAYYLYIHMNQNLPYSQGKKVHVHGSGQIYVYDLFGENSNNQRSYFNYVGASVYYNPEREIESKYCICLKTKYESCKENNVCGIRDVPIENYHHFLESDLGQIIADDPALTSYLYFPDNTDLAKYKIYFGKIKNELPEEKKIIFSPVQSSNLASLNIYFDDSIVNDYPMSLEIHNIDALRIKGSGDELDVSNFKVSSILFDNAIVNVKNGEVTKIPSLITDSTSLTFEYDGELHATEYLYLNLTESKVSTITPIFLGDSTSIYVNKISKLPLIKLDKDEIKISSRDKTISLSKTSSSGTHDIYITDETAIDATITNKAHDYFANLTVESKFDIKLKIEDDDGLTTQNINTTVVNSIHSEKELYLTAKSKNNDNIHLVGNLSVLLPDVESANNYLTSSLDKNSLNCVFIDYTSDELELEFKGDNSISFNTNYIAYIESIPVTINLICNTINVSTSLTNEYPNITFNIASNSCFAFDSSFQDKQTNIENLVFSHGVNEITFTTSLDFFPHVSVIDNISGVLYEGNEQSVTVGSTTNFSTEYFHSGPNLEVSCSDSFQFPQYAFLSKNTKINTNNNEITMIYYVQTRVNYIINGGNKFIFEPNDIKINTYIIEGIETFDTEIVSDKSISLEVSILECNFECFPNGNFKQIIVNENATINIDEASTQITIVDSYVSLENSSYKMTPLYKGADAYFRINTSASDIKLYAYGSSIPEKFEIVLTDDQNPKNIFFDKSWYKLEIPSSFVIITDSNNLTVSTSLIKLPKITIKNSEGEIITDYKIIEHKSKYTSELGFYILLIFAGIIIIISLLLCTCKNEEMDVSSSTDVTIFEEEDIDKSSNDTSENTIELGNENEDEEEEKIDEKDKNIEVNKDNNENEKGKEEEDNNDKQKSEEKKEEVKKDEVKEKDNKETKESNQPKRRNEPISKVTKYSRGEKSDSTSAEELESTISTEKNEDASSSSSEKQDPITDESIDTSVNESFSSMSSETTELTNEPIDKSSESSLNSSSESKISSNESDSSVNSISSVEQNELDSISSKSVEVPEAMPSESVSEVDTSSSSVKPQKKKKRKAK